MKMREIPEEIKSMYHVSKDQLRSEVRVTKKVRHKDGRTVYETSVMKWGAGKNPGIMLAPYKKLFEEQKIDRVAIQLESANPLRIMITKSERGRGRPKS